MGNVVSVLSTRNGSLAVAVGLPLVVGGAIASFAKDDVLTWFNKLRKPSWQPPKWLFGPVWSGLYALMGISSWMIWQREGFEGKGARALGLYAVQLAFNFAWTPLFFNAHRLDLALVDAIGMLASAVATTVAFNKIEPKAAAIFSPVIAWVSFATVLNAWLLENNPDADKLDGGEGTDVDLLASVPAPTGAVVPGTSKKLE